jgi:hypothetical protein
VAVEPAPSTGEATAERARSTPARQVEAVQPVEVVERVEAVAPVETVERAVVVAVERAVVVAVEQRRRGSAARRPSQHARRAVGSTARWPGGPP